MSNVQAVFVACGVLVAGGLVINLPGSPKAIRECLVAVFPAVPYCIELIEGPRLETDPNEVVAFRPKGAKAP